MNRLVALEYSLSRMNSVVDLHIVSVLILLDCEYVSKFFYFFIFL